MNTKMNELNLDEMEQVNGGSYGMQIGGADMFPEVPVEIRELPIGIFSREFIASLTGGEPKAK